MNHAVFGAFLQCSAAVHQEVDLEFTMRYAARMLQPLLAQQKRQLDFFFEHVDLQAIDALIDAIMACSGVVFFSGVGKSGLVAEKIAQTLTSTGTRSLFMDPTNALHGDIGIVTPQDLFVILSKSGESDELLLITPYLRNRGVRLYAVTSAQRCRLVNACDALIYLPLEKELCPFDLVPTTSAIVQMLFGDLLAVSLMQRKQFSIDQYALNHPAGKIGKRIALKVQDLMLKGSKIPFCRPDALLGDTLVELSDKRCGCLVVVDDDHILQGIFTDGDLRRSLQQYGSAALEKPLKQLMTGAPRCIEPHQLAYSAVQMMECDPNRPITVLPVLDDQRRVVGIIKMHDIVQSGL